MKAARGPERTRPTLADRLGSAAYIASTTLLSALPRAIVLPAARGIGLACYILMPARRRVAHANLRHAWPELSDVERRSIARGSFMHAGAMAADLLTLPRVARDPRGHCDVRAGDLERLRALVAQGRGVILVAGHFGLFESMGILLGHEGLAVSFVAKPFDNPLLDAAVAARRGATGNGTIHKGGAKARALEVLRAGGLVAIVADQHVTWRDRLWIPFFGLPAATARSLGTLAVESGAPVAGIHSYPLARGRCRFEVGAIIEASGDDPARAADVVVRGAIADLEAAARREPAAWLWLHRRWKICPDSERSRYPFYAMTESEERRIAESRGRLPAPTPTPEVND
jgi:KDO2-lipid IV(A) lauroyltransferase